MKILMLSDNYLPEMNANARIFSELAELWCKDKHQVSVITSHPNFPKGKIFAGYKNVWRAKSNVNGVNVTRVKTFMRPNHGFLGRVLDFLSFGFSSFIFGLFEKKCDIIVGVTPQFFCALSACLLATLKRKPFFMILCDLWPDSIVSNNVISKGIIYKILKKLELFMYHKASGIAILSPSFKNYLLSLSVDKEKIIDSISGPSRKFHPREKCKDLSGNYKLDGKIVIGYVGTFGISHNHEDILTVAKAIKRKNNVHFLMIGDGVKKQQLIKSKLENGLDNVTIDGPFLADYIPHFWSLCDVVIIPLMPTETNKTVIPSKILEAMAMGIPILLYTPFGTVTNFFLGSQAIWHVESGNIQELETLLLEISDHDLSYKRNAAIEFSKNFTRERQAEELLKSFYSTQHPRQGKNFN